MLELPVVKYLSIPFKHDARSYQKESKEAELNFTQEDKCIRYT